MAFELKPPAIAPEIVLILGGFRQRLFEPSDFIGEFPIAITKSAQSRGTSGRE